MATELKPIHLLLLEPSSNDAETMITTLRNQGYAVRATQVVSEDDLRDHLQRQSWDLCLTREELKTLTASQVVSLIDEYGRDIPVILITDKDEESTLVSALKLGIKDAVPFTSQQRLYLVVKRELENLEQRRLRKRAELQLAETEKRCSLLLDSSQDAIAYIHDGMHIYANQSYVELFGFEDPDELLCMPVMDMIASECHSDFKEFLRRYSKNPSNNNFACQGVTADGTQFEAIMTLSNATYDGEPCTQVLIKTTSDSAELEAKVRELSAQDVLTGLYNQAYFLEKLDETISVTSETGDSHHLLFVELDQYSEIEQEFGITGAEDIITSVAGWLQENAGDAILGRYGSESFVVLFEESVPENAKAFAEELCTKVRQHLFEIDGKTQKVTFSIGMTPVGDQANNARDLIGFAHAACLRAQKAKGDCVKVFNKMIDQGDSEHGEMIEKVQNAIESGKLHLMFQPAVKLHGDERPMYSTLLRIQSDRGEDIDLSQMFSIAEESGLAAKLDRWVIAQAIKQLRAHQSKASLFIQLSASSLTDESFAKFVVDLLKASKLPPSSLIFTIKASDALTYLKRVIILANTLRKVKIQLAISHLQNNSEHFALLDQILPNFAITDGDITTQLSAGGEAISDITQICKEAHQRDILTVTPKVEDAAALAALWPLGVGYIQGFYLQPPLSEMNFDFSANEF
jgi:diguanylate cyclase (GGDEF)-like protein/PAS domain S-box-containing protein